MRRTASGSHQDSFYPALRAMPATHPGNVANVAEAFTQDRPPIYTGGSEVANGIEGQKLAAALTAFVAATVRSHLTDAVELSSAKEDDSDSVKESVATAIATDVATVPAVPMPISRTDLETEMLTKVRWHVFNKMPIRLLAFNEIGTDLKLIGRNEIFSRILPGVHAAISSLTFEQDWAKSTKLLDGTQSRRNKQKQQSQLLTAAIESSAHYAILSHTWIRNAPGDVIYKDWEARELNQQGDAKITNFCRVAAGKHSVHFGWIDSICINKDSSSELDESIRSMYKWYRGAHICVTYLSETESISDGHRDSWFSRGWTLQELLAPLKTCFYNKHWDVLGYITDKAIQSLVSAETTITKNELQLCRLGDIERIPISRRMQLASGRQVTREEDNSYSLMGILGVDISIAYGEGSERAFYRLLRELLNTKPHILDLFNRTYDLSNKLMPSSVELYSGRTSFFDKSNWSDTTGSLLDQYQPLEPILLTHLGVRISLLLVPGLMTPDFDDMDYVPLGNLSGKTRITLTSEEAEKHYCYNLLDSRLYADNLAPLRAFEDELNRWYLIGIFGIFNYGFDNDNILLPKWCISLPLHCDGSKPGKISPSDSIHISPWSPPVFQLSSAENKFRLSIPKNKLAEHGLQLVTLYF